MKENADLLGSKTAVMDISKQAQIVSLDQVTVSDIDWLWPDYIPMGMLTLLVGDPSAAKSFLTLFIAAAVSSGLNWPTAACHGGLSGEAKRARPGSVLLLNNEDSPEKIILPRLKALNADLSKIKMIPSVCRRDKFGAEFTDFFNITTDLLILQKAISQIPDLKLIIIDPLTAFIGYNHKGSYLRTALFPLIELARKLNIAVLGVMHLTKTGSANALYRPIGGLSVTAAAKTICLVSSIPNGRNPQRRLFIPVKNIFDNPPALAFEIKNNSLIFEDKPVNIPSEAVLCHKDYQTPERDRAVEWLTNLLEDGRGLPVKEIEKLAASEGIKEHTLRRAREKMYIKSFSRYDELGNKFSAWCLADPPDPYLLNSLLKSQKNDENRKLAGRMKNSVK